MTNEEKIHELNVWFDFYFAKQLQQHSWQKDYKPSKDPYLKNEDGTPKTYSTFEDLTQQAQFVRDEIKRLKNL